MFGSLVCWKCCSSTPYGTGNSAVRNATVRDWAKIIAESLIKVMVTFILSSGQIFT